jgi:hypothetical protein
MLKSTLLQFLCIVTIKLRRAIQVAEDVLEKTQRDVRGATC